MLFDLYIISLFWAPLHRWQLVKRKFKHPRIWELEAIFTIISFQLLDYWISF